MTRHADRDRSGAYWPPAAAAAYDEPVPYVPTEPDAPDIWAEVRGERERAHAKHGEKSMESWPTDNHLRLTILLEEVGEVAREFNEAALSDRPVDLEALRSELIQVAAMAGAWADACPVPERLDAKDAEIADLRAELRLAKDCWAVDMRAAQQSRATLARAEKAIKRAEKIQPEGSTEWRESGLAMQRTILRELRAALAEPEQATP